MITNADILKIVNECLKDKFENSHIMISIMRDEDSVETMGIGDPELALPSVAVLFEQLIEKGYDRGELFYLVADIMNKKKENEDE